MGTSGKGLGTVEPVGYEPNPNAALKPCRAATSLSVVDKNAKFKRLLMLKKYNMGPMEKENARKRQTKCWIGFWRRWTHLDKNMGKKTGTRSSDSTRRSLMGKGVGESGMALTGAGGSGALVQVAAVRAGAGKQIAQNPAVAEEVARPVSLPPEEPPGLEVVRGKGNGGLLSGLTPGVNSLTLSGVPMTQPPVVARMSEGFRGPPVVGTREEGQGGEHQGSTEPLLFWRDRDVHLLNLLKMHVSNKWCQRRQQVHL